VAVAVGFREGRAASLVVVRSLVAVSASDGARMMHELTRTMRSEG
jgi:hypothetical protein